MLRKEKQTSSKLTNRWSILVVVSRSRGGIVPVWNNTQLNTQKVKKKTTIKKQKNKTNLNKIRKLNKNLTKK